MLALVAAVSVIGASAMRRFRIGDDGVATLPRLRRDQPRQPFPNKLGGSGDFHSPLLAGFPEHIQHDAYSLIWEHNIRYDMLVNRKISYMICLARIREAPYGSKNPLLGGTG